MAGKPRGTAQPVQKINLNTIKKYIEQGYQAGWGEGYVWNDDLVILRKENGEDNGERYNYVIISKSHQDVIIKDAL